MAVAKSFSQMSGFLFSEASGKYEALPMEEGTPRTRSPSPWTARFWIATTFFFASLSAWLGAERLPKTSPGSFATGWNTEFKPARPLIELEQRTYDGAPHFHENSSAFFVDELQYVGEPSRAIDHAWALLTWGRFIHITEEEARTAWGEHYTDFWSPKDVGYVTGIEMFHTLHCLDHIRKNFYPSVYKMDSIHGVLHRDHCINHLRQMIMCNADMTPIPTRWYPGINQNYIDSNRPHTCRNFDKLRAWMSERYNGSLAVAFSESASPEEGAVNEWN